MFFAAEHERAMAKVKSENSPRRRGKKSFAWREDGKTFCLGGKSAGGKKVKGFSLFVARFRRMAQKIAKMASIVKRRREKLLIVCF